MLYPLWTLPPSLAMRPLLLVVFALAVPVATAQSLPQWAQPSDPGAPVSPDVPVQELTPTPPGTPALVPIDGGLGLLALAGGAYAAARLRRRED